MKTCPHCKQSFLGGRSFGAHITNCKLNPNRLSRIEKAKSKKTIQKIEYKLSCIKCGSEYVVYVSEKDFNNKKYKSHCSRKCANSHLRTDESKLKSSKSNIGKTPWNKGLVNIYSDQSNLKRSAALKIYYSNNTISKPGSGSKIGRKLSSEIKNKISQSNKGKTGGLRQKGGRGKQGWYKGIYCNSSWELAYVIYCKDHNIDILRNKEGFEYTFNNQIFKFYPDFIVNNEFVEIKGYLDAKNKAKILQFSKKLTVIDKNSINQFLDYVILTYGKDFIKLYE